MKTLCELEVVLSQKIPFTDPIGESLTCAFKVPPIPVIDVDVIEDEDGNLVKIERQSGVSDRINVTIELPEYMGLKPGDKIQIVRI